MPQQLTAIDVGSRRMKFVTGSAGKNSIKIKKMFYVETPEGAVNNGEITDEEALLGALQDTVKTYKLTGKKTVLTLQSSLFISREFSIPKLTSEKETASALLFEAEQYMPIELSDYIMSFRKLSEQKDEDTGNVSVKYLVGLMPRRMVEGYHKLLIDAGLNPVVMDVNANALEKFMDFCGFGNETVLAADIGDNSMDITVIDNGVSIINRTVPIGGSDITRSIKSVLEVDMAEAEVKKIENVNLFTEEELSPEESESTSLAKPVVADWVEQLRRMADFYMSRSKGKSVDSVYIYGGSSSLKGLTQYLRNSFGITVRTIDFPSDIRYKGEPGAPEYVFVNAVGALIRRQVKK